MVPVYFFHLRGGSSPSEDEQGLEFADDEAARAAALAGARGMLAADVLDGILDLSSRIEVTDERGATLFNVPFESAVTTRT